MEAHTAHHAHFGRRSEQRGRIDAATVVRTGLIAGAIAGMMMAMWQMVVGAIAQDPTAVPTIHQSFWTAVTSITSVIFGLDAFHGSFHFWSVIGGVGGHMMNSMMLGVVGVGLLTAVQGRRPHPLGAIMQGVMFGLVLEVVIVNLIVNRIQDVNTLYTSTPEWSWWVAHGIFGMTLGLVAATLLRRGSAARSR
jgi:hypothetical protein